MASKTKTSEASEKLFKETWGKIVVVLDQVYDVLQGKATSVAKDNCKDKMGWYALIYNASTQDQLVSDKLYQQLRSWLQVALDERVTKPVLAKCKNTSDTDDLFREVTSSYRQFKVCISLGKVVFHYLGSYVTKRSGNDTIELVYLKAYNLAVYNQVKDALRTVIIKQVNARRDGNQVDMTALKAAVGIFIDVGTATAADEKSKQEVYSKDFEAQYLTALHDMYKKRTAAELTSDGGHFTYLKWVESRQELELSLATDLLRPSSFDTVRQATEDEMITPHFRTIVNHPDSGCAVLLEDWKEVDLARMYKLMKRVKEQEALHEMGKAMQKRIVEEGKRLLSDFEGATSDGPLSLEKPLVTSVVELNKKYGKLITERFENAALFMNYRKLGFTEFLKAALKRKDPKPSAGEGAVEEKETSFSEVLATFLDAVMKRELKDVVEHDAEMERLDDLLTVFTYITEKDVFQEFYKAKLAKRLLQTTPNEDLEKGFLERLQREMGKSFTHKMEGMLLDRDSTRAFAEKFAQDSSSAGLGVEFEVRVLTAVNWPAYKSDNLQPPLSLKRCVEAFTRFYKKSHQTRRLTWINMLGSATLNLLFPKGTKDVTATLHQASVLVLVDEAGQLSVRTLAEALGLELKGLKPHIASMYLSKFQLLQLTNEAGEKQATAKTIGDDDYFAMNPEFKHSTRKFRLPAPLAKADGDVNAPPIDDRRKIQIDAAVVRIMKSRKTLSYAELQDMTINMLSKYFIAQPKMVKARVEDLVTREYLKRHDDDPKMFDYLA